MGARDRPGGADRVPRRACSGSLDDGIVVAVRRGGPRRPRRPAGRARGVHRAARRRARPRPAAHRAGAARDRARAGRGGRAAAWKPSCSTPSSPTSSGRAGALPLLSTALVGTWERRRGDRLTLAGYLEAGGVAGALTRSAEAAYAALDDGGRELGPPAARPAGRHRRRRRARPAAGAARRARTWTASGGGAPPAVVETFVDRRLLSVDGDRLEVAHEALLTALAAAGPVAGGRRRRPRRAPAPGARRARVGGRAGGRTTSSTGAPGSPPPWTGRPAADADVTPVEQQFLEASRASGRRRAGARRGERADREATARRRTRRLAVGLAAVLVVALVAAGLAVRSQRRRRAASTWPRTPTGWRRCRRRSGRWTFVPARCPGLPARRHPGDPRTRCSRSWPSTGERRVRCRSGDPFGGGRLADGGRTLFIAAWRPRSSAGTSAPGSRHGPRDQATLDEGAGTGGTATDALADRRPACSLVGGARTTAPGSGLAGRRRPRRAVRHGDELGGEPFGVAVHAGRPLGWTSRGAGAAPGAPVPDGGWSRSTRPTGRGGRPGSPAACRRPGWTRSDDISEDVSTAVLCEHEHRPRATLVDLATGAEAERMSPPGERRCRRRRVPGAALRRRPAVERRHGHVVDRTGAVVQELDRSPGAGLGRRAGAGRDVGGHRRGGRRGRALGRRPGDRPLVAARVPARAPRRRARGRDRPGWRATVHAVRRQHGDRLGRQAGRGLRDLAPGLPAAGWPTAGGRRARAGWSSYRPAAGTRPARRDPVPGGADAERGGDLPRPAHRRGRRPGAGGGHRRGRVYFGASVAVSPDSTPGWPSPPAWPPPCSTPAPRGGHAPIVLPATGDLGADGAALPAGSCGRGAGRRTAPAADRHGRTARTSSTRLARGAGEIAVVDTATWRVVRPRLSTGVPR